MLAYGVIVRLRVNVDPPQFAVVVDPTITNFAPNVLGWDASFFVLVERLSIEQPRTSLSFKTPSHIRPGDGEVLSRAPLPPVRRVEGKLC